MLGWQQFAPVVCSHHLYTYAPFKEIINGQIHWETVLASFSRA